MKTLVSTCTYMWYSFIRKSNFLFLIIQNKKWEFVKWKFFIVQKHSELSFRHEKMYHNMNLIYSRYQTYPCNFELKIYINSHANYSIKESLQKFISKKAKHFYSYLNTFLHICQCWYMSIISCEKTHKNHQETESQRNPFEDRKFSFCKENYHLVLKLKWVKEKSKYIFYMNTLQYTTTLL